MAVATVRQRIDIGQAAAAPRWPALAKGEIHLWHVTSAVPLHAGALHELLHRLLCHYAQLDVARIKRDPHGKPWLDNCPRLHFNISHSGGTALFAFAWDQPLGVDAEHGSRLRSPLHVARRFFHEEEAAQLAALPPARQQVGFLSLWAGKEAVLKAMGRGLAWGLDRLVLRIDQRGELSRLQHLDGHTLTDWHLVAIDLPGSGRGALAWQGADRQVRAMRTAICDQQ